MDLLITGGAGFIGCNLVRLLVSSGEHDITVLDKLTYAGSLENLGDVIDDIKFIRGDITDPKDVEPAMNGCDHVINLAAETHVDRSIMTPDSFVKTDVLGTFTLLEAARRHDVKRFLQIGTDEVYGSLNAGSATESSVLDPSSPYSASKASADLLVKAYHKTYGMNVVITRSCNNFGPFQYPEKLIPLFILRASAGKKLPLYGSGMQVRDWIYVEDNCRALIMVLQSGVSGEIYNVGAGYELANYDVARQILSTLGKGIDQITHVADRPGHDLRYFLNSDKIRALGWQPRWEFQKALKATVDWYRENSWRYKDLSFT